MRTPRNAPERPESALPAACAYEHCARSALYRVKTAFGWASLCRAHYDQFHADEAREWCKAKGINTWQEQRNAVFVGVQEWIARTVRSA